MKRGLVLGCLLVGALAVARPCRCDREEPAVRLRVATFNIEDFPRSKAQIDGAFDEMTRLHASVIALQEIIDPAVFSTAMRARLGPSWELAFADTRPLEHPSHHLAVAFDRETWRLTGTKLHDDTRLPEGRWKPTFEVRLAPRAGGPELSIVDVHLKAGSDGRSIRARQYVALAAIIARIQRTTTNRIVVLGDFNATDDVGDRADLAQLARASGLTWATRTLACSAFWNRDDGCPRSRLDQVLTWTPSTRYEVTGACATHGCDWEDSCPVYRAEVSDHCPVLVEI